MGNPNAAQEPSMEEILASIRQIISEDGEGEEDGVEAKGTAGSEPAGASTPDKAEEPVAAADEDTKPVGYENLALTDPEADAQDEDDSRTPFETMAQESDDAEPKADDLVDTGPYENPFETFTEKSKNPDSADAEDHPHMDDEPELAEDAADEPTLVSSEPAPEPEPTEDNEPAAEHKAEAIASNQIVEPESQTMPASAQPAEFDHDDKLISPESGASVANAFSALTHTILSQNARTLDDLVSDMLQPMLKEWLDENLPTLVERMVKQEIDRMARGGR